MDNPSMNPSDMFRQSMDAFQSAIKSGVKLQEESIKRCANIVRNLGSPMEWQKNTQALINEAIMATQHNIAESIRIMNENAQKAMGLLKKGFDTQQTQPSAPAQETVDGIWEVMLTAMRTNTQSILDANGRILDSWTQLSKEVTDRMEQNIQNGAKAAQGFAQTVEKQAAAQA